VEEEEVVVELGVKSVDVLYRMALGMAILWDMQNFQNIYVDWLEYVPLMIES
jgi:hypothetical protein